MMYQNKNFEKVSRDSRFLILEWKIEKFESVLWIAVEPAQQTCKGKIKLQKGLKCY